MNEPALTGPQQAFIDALRAVCREHGVVLSTSDYDHFYVWPAADGEDPIYGGDDRIEFIGWNSAEEAAPVTSGPQSQQIDAFAQRLREGGNPFPQPDPEVRGR